MPVTFISTGVAISSDGVRVISTLPRSTVYAVAGVVGQFMTVTVKWRNIRNAVYSFSDLPAGLTGDAATGVISGIPTTVATLHNSAVTATTARGRGISLLQFVISDVVSHVPVITSAASLTGIGSQPFSYQITGSYLTPDYAPVSYAKVSGPSWLSVDADTGAVTSSESGLWPAAGGTGTLVVKATNVDGDSANFSIALTWTAAPSAPVITSALTASGQTGSAFSYQITATNSPTSYSTTSYGVVLLAAKGLSLNTSTGEISGTVTSAGVITILISAWNAAGIGSAPLVLTTIATLLPPEITSPLTWSSDEDTPDSYIIRASNSPNGYAATNLPTGLSRVGNVITGQVATPGVYNIGISASNAAGFGTVQTLVWTIADVVNRPVISNGSTADATQGLPFSLQIVATNTPTLYAVLGNAPSWMSVDADTGLVTGTPDAAAVYALQLYAENEDGGVAKDITITVASASPWNVKVAADATLTAPMALTGSYVSQASQTTDPTAAGKAIFSATVPSGSAGRYYLVADVDCADGASDSFFVQVDADPTTLNIWPVGATSGQESKPVIWRNALTPQIFTLTEAAHSFRFFGREANAKLYGFTITAEVAPYNVTPSSVNGQQGVALALQMSASGYPTLWSASGLPAGLSIDTATGLITGTPTGNGTTVATVTAFNGLANANTSGAQNVTFTIAAPTAPVVTSAGTWSINKNQAASYSITATNSPTSFAASPLPTGLSVNTSTGVISGTPTVEQVVSCTASATNAGGTGNKTVTMTVNAPSTGTTHTAASPAYADVLAKVSIAARGDTVAVPAGSATWTSQLYLTKGIHLQGAGRDLTFITYGHAPVGGEVVCAIVVQPDATAIANEEVIRVTGFDFNGQYLANAHVYVEGAYYYAGKPFKNLAFGHNRFRNSLKISYNNGAFYVFRQVRGVVYDNIFENCNVIVKAAGNDALEEWENNRFPFAYGDGDNLFFEGNTFQWTTANFSDPGWTETGHSARLCMRYNTFDYTNPAQHAAWSDAKQAIGFHELMDAHGFGVYANNVDRPGTGVTGTMVSEYYGNTILNWKGSRCWALRGSWGLWHNNIFTGTGGGTGDCMLFAGSTAVEVPGALGHYIPEVNNAYFFNNTKNGTNIPSQYSVGGHPPNSQTIFENANWWNYNASFNGTTGIGRGTAAPTGSCTTGVGYWQCSTATPTADPNIVQTGTLWKATATNTWTAYYTPYTYPHPLAT